MSEILEMIRSTSAKNPYACYQCGMCSAVCPMVRFMDIPPHQVIRLVQLRADGMVIKSKTVWVCVSCMRCVDRCPRDVAPGVIFESLRLVLLRQGIDKIKYEELVNLEEVPTMALVATSRKLTG